MGVTLSLVLDRALEVAGITRATREGAIWDSEGVEHNGLSRFTPIISRAYKRLIKLIMRMSPGEAKSLVRYRVALFGRAAAGL